METWASDRVTGIVLQQLYADGFEACAESVFSVVPGNLVGTLELVVGPVSWKLILTAKAEGIGKVEVESESP